MEATTQAGWECEKKIKSRKMECPLKLRTPTDKEGMEASGNNNTSQQTYGPRSPQATGTALRPKTDINSKMEMRIASNIDDPVRHVEPRKIANIQICAACASLISEDWGIKFMPNNTEFTSISISTDKASSNF